MTAIVGALQEGACPAPLDVTVGQRPPSRLAQLDVLRGVAVLLVLGHHLPPFPAATPAPVLVLADAFRWAGWSGVDLFFVLSGFLVSGLIFGECRRHGDFHLHRFLLRRSLKIFPAFYVFLLLALPTVSWIPGKVTGSGLLVEATFLQDYLPHPWGHTWSLAVEEQFYLWLGVLLLLLSARPGGLSVVPGLCLATCLFALAMRAAACERTPFSFETHMTPVHLRCDALAFGVLLAWIYHWRRPWLDRLLGAPARRGAVLATGLAMLLPVLIAGYRAGWPYVAGLTLLYLGFGLIMVTALEWHVPRGLAWLARVGFYSYSIYLWHMPASYLAYLLPPQVLGMPVSFGARVTFYLAGSIAIGVLMARLVEQPCLRLRDRFIPSRGRALQSAADLARSC